MSCIVFLARWWKWHCRAVSDTTGPSCVKDEEITEEEESSKRAVGQEEPLRDYKGVRHTKFVEALTVVLKETICPLPSISRLDFCTQLVHTMQTLLQCFHY